MVCILSVVGSHPGQPQMCHAATGATVFRLDQVRHGSEQSPSNKMLTKMVMYYKYMKKVNERLILFRQYFH